MGKEQIAPVRIDMESAPLNAQLAKVHLDSQYLQIGAPFKRKIALDCIQAIQVQGDDLYMEFALTHGNKSQLSKLRISLGNKHAMAWQKAIAEPPSLAKKLGLSDELTIYLQLHSSALLNYFEAAPGSQTGLAQAKLCFIEVSKLTDLKALSTIANELKASQMLWVIRGKGKTAAVTESEIMSSLAKLGFKPNKTCAWSEQFCADRYARKTA